MLAGSPVGTIFFSCLQAEMHSNAFVAFHVCTEFGQELLTAVIARKRRIVTAGVAGFLSGETQTCGQGPQGSKVKFDDPFSWAAHLKRLTEREFKLRYISEHLGSCYLLITKSYIVITASDCLIPRTASRGEHTCINLRPSLLVVELTG